MDKASGDSGHKSIVITGASEHNLKNISVVIPRDKLVVITGISGSGKSSLAFDTIYAEGQRKYVESLSAYARQFLEQMQKPHVEHIEGLPPTIAIEQRSASSNPRSTVATTTEIYDYLPAAVCPGGRSRTAGSAASRSPASTPRRSSMRSCRGRRGRRFRSARRWSAGKRASTARSSRGSCARASCGSRIDGQRL